MHDSDYMYLQQPMNTLNSGIIESVDSISRDGTDTPYI